MGSLCCRQTIEHVPMSRQKESSEIPVEEERSDAPKLSSTKRSSSSNDDDEDGTRLGTRMESEGDDDSDGGSVASSSKGLSEQRSLETFSISPPKKPLPIGRPDLSPANSSDDDDDPHNLKSRFVLNHAYHFRQALSEIQQGEKQSCWLWFVLPTAPYIVDGVERGSGMNRHFALRTDEQAMEYLRLPPQEISMEGDIGGDDGDGSVVILRQNYLDMAAAVLKQLQEGNTMMGLFGFMDAPKAVSSFKLFRRIGKLIDDKEVHDACDAILNLGGGTKRSKTRLFRVKSM